LLPSHSVLISSPRLPLFSFFLYCSAAPRHLHSFPTRRSSDLVARRRDVQVHPGEQVRGRASRPRPLQHPQLLRPEQVTRLAGARSEEHTSELQSRENLVCRLLLEKKKKERQASTSEMNPLRNP